MRKYFIILGLSAIGLTSLLTSCKKESFDEFYRDPSKTNETTIDKQFAGITYQFRELVIPSYWNYFVILRTTTNRFVQAVGWINEPNQLIPGVAAVQDRWSSYYAGLAQFKEFERIYLASHEADQEQFRIFYLAAKVFFYDQTQQIVDIHGDIPWSEAGKLNANKGDYSISYAAFDKAEDIYKTMLDDLKEISTELSTLQLGASTRSKFITQDMINGGSIDAWRKYCNSLRLRMLTRVLKSPEFTSRAHTELTEIIGNPAAFPIVADNTQNIQWDVFDPANEWINARGFRDGIETGNGNISGKKMIDYMVSKSDPRLPFMFEKGGLSPNAYVGLDPSLPSGTQQQLVTGVDGQTSLSIYNRSTYSRNQKFPGLLISAAEVSFLLAEYYHRNGDDGSAKSSFEKGIKQSIEMIINLRAISNNDDVVAPQQPTVTEIGNYITDVGWSGNILELIGYQKWLHFNIIQPIESWAEVRRLNYPTFNFRVDPADIQKSVPNRWNIPSSEQTYNAANYNAVKDNDNVNHKLFWDVD